MNVRSLKLPTVPKHAGLDRVNPGSVILSGVMMLGMGWQGGS